MSTSDDKFRAPSSIGLKIGFAVILLLLVALTLTGLSRMAMINQRMEKVVNENNVKTRLVYDMKNAVNTRAIMMHSIALMSDTFDQQDEYLNFNTQGVIFVEARRQLLQMPLSEAEKKDLESVREIISRTNPQVLQGIDLAMNGKKLESLELIASGIVPLQKKLSLHLDQMARIQEQDTARAVKEMSESYANTRLLLLLIGGAATLMGLAIAAAVIRLTSEQTDMLRHLAMYDSLTGLPNRTLFADRLEQAILIGRREKQPFALLAMDLNRFKEVNDTFGHHVGDLVLQHVAARVLACLRESDTAARMGGDEFSILLASVSNVDGAAQVIRKILEALDGMVALEGHPVTINASLGIAMFPEHGDQAAVLERNADAAMYLAKHLHLGYRVYSADLRAP